MAGSGDAQQQEVYYEFNRVVGKNRRESFLDALDHHSPNLMDIFRRKKGFVGQILAELLSQTKSQQMLGPFAFVDCQSYWVMTHLPSLRPVLMSLTRTRTTKYQ
ncbi:uncharacterized protein Hap1MRO34_004422 isoform 1-T1 [Clarias gariepinus]